MSRLARFVLVLAMILAFGAYHTGEAARKVVAVMPMENAAGNTGYRVAEVMTEQIIHALHNSGSYTVAERNQLGAAIREIGFQMTGMVDPNQAIELGQMTGAEYSVIGKVILAEIGPNQTRNIIGLFARGAARYADPYKGKVSLMIRFIDNRTGEDVLSTRVDGSESGSSPEVAIYDACKEAAERFMKEVQTMNPVTATVIHVSGGTVYIDQGSDSGIRMGETLSLVREGLPITNMAGKIIAMEYVPLGRIKVDEVNGNHSICHIIDRTDSGLIVKGVLAKRGK